MNKNPSKRQRAAARKREARPDVAVGAPGMMPGRARPSLVDEVRALPASTKRGWNFTPEQRAEIDQVRAAMAAGTLYISATALARHIQARYDLRVKFHTIRNKLVEIAGGKW